MRFYEMQEPNKDAEKLAALSQFLTSRAQDTGTKKSISTQRFLSLARDQGISLTVNNLKQMSQQAPLNNLIADVQGDSENGEVVFKGDESTPDTMSVDQARITVDQMAKRAAAKNSKPLR